LFLLSFTFLLFLPDLLTSQSLDFACSIKSSCSSNEVCLFSFISNNSHAATCDHYPLKICCTGLEKVEMKGECEYGEKLVVTLANHTNSHLGINFYPIKVCAKWKDYPIVLAFKNNCSSDENCIFSLAQSENSHLGDCGYYSLKLCGKKIKDLVLDFDMGGPYLLREDHSTVVITGKISFAENSPVNNSFIEAKIIKDGIIQKILTTYSSPNGNFFLVFNLSQPGIYLAEIQANYLVSSVNLTKTFEVRREYERCVLRTLNLTGKAIDWDTGEPIEAGTVIIIIKEKGDVFIGNIHKGKWQLNFTSCLVPGKDYTLQIILKTPTGKISISHSKFKAP